MTPPNAENPRSKTITETAKMTSQAPIQATLLNALPHPVIFIGPDDHILEANDAAQHFFQSSATFMRRHTLDHFIPFGSPLLDLVAQVRTRQAAVSEYRVDVSSPRIGAEKIVDIYASPLVVPGLDVAGGVILMLQERGMAEKIDRQLTHRGAALLDRVVNQQAQIIAFIDDYRMMIFTTMPALALLFLMRRPRTVPRPSPEDSHAAMD